MSVNDFFAGEIATELLKQLVLISAKAWRYKFTAKKLLTSMENIQPTIKEIQYSGVELPAHRQAQIGMLFDVLERGKKLTDKILDSKRWSVHRQLTLARKLEKLEKRIFIFLKSEVHTRILADVHCLLDDSSVRVDKRLEREIEQVGSMEISGGGFISDVMERAEATMMEIDTNENYGVELELGNRNGKKKMLQSQGETSGSSGMGGVIESHHIELTQEIVVDLPKLIEYFSTEGKENTIVLEKILQIVKGITCGATPVRSSSSSYAKAHLLDRTLTNSLMDSKIIPPQIQVFINFRGAQLRKTFVGYLVDALKRRGVNVFIDNFERRGKDIYTLFKRIEESRIAIVVFSSRYTQSNWCLDELVKIKERVQQGKLEVLPIFYKVDPTNVKRLKGEFGDHFRDKEYRYGSDSPQIKAWKEAIVFVTEKHALVYDEKSGALEIDFVESIVKEVLEMLKSVSIVESGQSSRYICGAVDSSVDVDTPQYSIALDEASLFR